jgi:hypothetical protein
MTDDTCTCDLDATYDMHVPPCRLALDERMRALLELDAPAAVALRIDDGGAFPRAVAIKSCRECPYYQAAMGRPGIVAICCHPSAPTRSQVNVTLPIPPHDCPLRAQAELLAVPDCRHDYWRSGAADERRVCLACGLPTAVRP